MRWTRTLIPTLRQDPAGADVPSHRLMLRAGLIQQVASGAYSYLPLGWRVLHKVIRIVRQEMDAAGAAEVLMPALQPVELWERTGRRSDYGYNLFVVEDRHGRENALGPTHEEVITELVKTAVSSYRDLPLTLYQIQTKFRDEYRPRFGVLRSREFQMKDAYSFDLTPEGLDESYNAMHAAYQRIFTRCGLRFVEVEAASGPIGGSASAEFMIPSPTGEDVILASDKNNYAANVEKCAIGPRRVSESFSAAAEAHGLESVGFEKAEAPTGELERVHTPGCATIDDVCEFFTKQLSSKLNKQNMLKTLVCKSDEGQWVVGVVRADHELNEGKLQEAVSGGIALADDAEARSAGFAIGYVGPHIAAGRDNVSLVVDPDAACDQFWVTGGNEADYHVKHFHWKRDVLDHVGADRIRIADIRNAIDGDPSPTDDGGVLRESRGIEVGHVFKLGTKYSEALDLAVLDENQRRVHPIMGCYGIGVNRIIAAAIEAEEGHDEAGIVWPMAMAPYHVLITPIKYEGRAAEVADELHAKLTERGVEVLLDDRDERPGVKFKDGDLIGIPLRITVGDKGLKNEQVELKERSAAEAEMVGLDQIVDYCADRVSEALGPAVSAAGSLE